MIQHKFCLLHQIYFPNTTFYKNRGQPNWVKKYYEIFFLVKISDSDNQTIGLEILKRFFGKWLHTARVNKTAKRNYLF